MDVKLKIHSEGHYAMISDSGCFYCAHESVCGLFRDIQVIAKCGPFEIGFSCADYMTDPEDKQ